MRTAMLLHSSWPVVLSVTTRTSEVALMKLVPLRKVFSSCSRVAGSVLGLNALPVVLK